MSTVEGIRFSFFLQSASTAEHVALWQRYIP